MGPGIDEAASPEVVRVTPDRRRAEEWGLVLAAAAIDSRIEWSLRGYALLVRGDQLTAAAGHLDAYDLENRPLPPPTVEYGPNRAGLITAVVLSAFFVVTGPRADGAFWFEHGASSAARLAAGEWWRTVTALTLHADFPHILGNAITMILFGSALCTAVGPGSALMLMLLAGAGGNAMATGLRGAPHSSVGASTAIFAAVGALAALQMLRRRRLPTSSRWRTWLPLAAGFGLLALLGSSAQSDVLAHAFGFLLGAVLAALLGVLRPEPFEPRTQNALVASVAAAVLGAWLLALIV